MKSKQFLWSVLVLWVAACEGSDPVAPPAETPVASVRVEPDTATLTVGQTLALQARAFASNGTPLHGRSPVWSSGDTTVAVVTSSGMVATRGAGVATVRAAIEGKTGIATIRVQAATVPVASVQIGPEGPHQFAPGDTIQLIAKTYAEDGSELTGRLVTWESSRSEVASVTPQGFVRAITDGETDIIATSENRSTRVRIAVKTPPQSPQIGSISTRPSVIITYVGVDANIQATVHGPNGNVLEGTPIVWTSSDPNVATVSPNGVVKGIRGGEAVITASAGGKSSTVAAVFNTTSSYHLVYDRESPAFYWMDMRTGSSEAGLAHMAGVRSLDPSPSPTRSGFAYTHRIAGGLPYIMIQNWRRTTYQYLTDGEHAAWSPDGTRIAFRRTEAGRTDIWSILADGSANAVRLTGNLPDGTVSERPAWSPSGDQIVFAASNARNGSDLWIMNADGSGLRRLANGAQARYSEPTWHGDRIVFTRHTATDTSDLFWIHVNGASVQQLTALGGAQMPAWSPDGRWIAFVVRDNPFEIGDIFVVPPTGGEARPLSLRSDGPDGGGLNPAWTLHW